MTDVPSDFIKVYDGALPPELCAEIIRRFNDDARVEPDPQPDYSTRKYLNISQCFDWRKINIQLAQVVGDLVTDYFDRDDELAAATHRETSDDGFVVVRYDPGDAVIMHVDGQCSAPPNNGLRLATALFYLNDVPEGGETYFPLQKRSFKPEQGKAIVFPVGFTHPHSVIAATTKRYVMQTWITDPGLFVFADGDMP